MVNSAEQESYTIRGHHLDYLAPLFPPRSESPETIAHKLREESVRDRGDLSIEEVNWGVLSSPDSTDVYNSTYGLDLVGVTEEDADLYEERLREAIDMFVKLDDADVVRLTAIGLDNICRACTFQQHCQVPDGFDAEQKYLDIFGDVLGFATTKDPNFTAEVSRADEGDIITTAKTVRRFIGHFAIANNWRVNLFNDAFSRRKEYGGVFAGPDASLLEQYYDEYGHEIE